jgi:hypothetical protein
MYFDIFGERIVVHANDEAMAARLASSLSAFQTTSADKPCAVFSLVRREDMSPVRRGQQFNDGRLLVIADRFKLVTASLGAMPWRIHLETFGQDDQYAYYYVFEPLLLAVLKRRNLVHWHAAAVSRRETIVLIVGESGSGKSTTTLTLMLDGYGFVADDDLFLVAAEDGVTVRSVERALHFTDATAAFVRGAPQGLPLVRRGGTMKRRLDIGADPPKEYPRLIRDAPSLERQFATCATLAATAKCFELELGQGLGTVPRLVDEAIG